MIFHGLMERARRVWKLPSNPVHDLDRPHTAPSAGGIDVFSPEEVLALVRHADDEQDAALFLTAAFTGHRQGELVALRWRDVDFPGEHVRVAASYTNGALTSPNERQGALRADGAGGGGGARPAVPARALDARRDLVFPGAAGAHVDASALVKRYKRALAAAGLRPLRFHDLRHTFGTTMIPQGPTSSASRSGWVMRTSRRRASTCTSRRGRTTPAWSPRRSPSIERVLTFPNTALALRSKRPKKRVEAALQDAESE
jgi:integrase